MTLITAANTGALTWGGWCCVPSSPSSAAPVRVALRLRGGPRRGPGRLPVGEERPLPSPRGVHFNQRRPEAAQAITFAITFATYFRRGKKKPDMLLSKNGVLKSCPFFFFFFPRPSQAKELPPKPLSRPQQSSAQVQLNSGSQSKYFPCNSNTIVIKQL